MHLKLKRIAPIQAGKLLAAFYGLFSLLFVPFMAAFMALGSFAAKHQAGGAATPALPAIFGMGIGFMLLFPLIYAAMGFVFGVLAAALYNLLAGWLGGLELTFESSTPPAAPPPLAARQDGA